MIRRRCRRAWCGGGGQWDDVVRRANDGRAGAHATMSNERVRDRRRGEEGARECEPVGHRRLSHVVYSAAEGAVIYARGDVVIQTRYRPIP